MNDLTKTLSNTTPVMGRQLYSFFGFLFIFSNVTYFAQGIAGLYQGITPTVLGILPYAGIAFTINEQGKRRVSQIFKRDVV